MAASSDSTAPTATETHAGPRRSRRWGVLAVLIVGVAFAYIAQPTADNANAHYALVRSLADGRPYIDPYADETIDKGYFEGHYYAVKPPGLALFSLPPYLVLEALDAVPENPVLAVWILNLWASVLAAVLLLLAVRSLGERLAPTLGAAAAITLGLGTLVFPFSTLYFAHVLAAALAFGAFFLLWREREREPRLAVVAAAGVMAGLAVTVENTLGIAAIALALYALLRPGRLRRGLAYGAGLLAGIIPLLAFDWWAFGSPLRTPYRYLLAPHSEEFGPVLILGQGGGFFGIGTPKPEIGLQLLFSGRGLITLMPIAAVGIAALVAVWRRGWHAETIAIVAVAIGFLVFNAGYYHSFGGAWGGSAPGPRFLLATLPFLAVPLAIAYQRFPFTTALLASLSAMQMVAATATEPLLPDYGTFRWSTHLAEGKFTGTAIRVMLGGFSGGWPYILPLLTLVVAAVVCAYASASRASPARHDVETGFVAFAGWLVLAVSGHRVLQGESEDVSEWRMLTLVLLLGATCAAVSRAVQAGWRGAVPAAPLLVLAVPAIADHPGWVAATSAFVLVLFALGSRRELRGGLTASRVRLRHVRKALGRRQRTLAGRGAP
jgi:hypothetical protein